MSVNADNFSSSLLAGQESFGVDIPTEAVNQLTSYYKLLQRWNERLHLVAPCPAEEFATRHVLESLLVTKLLSVNAKVVDVGSGAGLPIIPCMILRPDINVTLIESSQKKTVFLREAMNQLGIRGATIIGKTFEETIAPEADYVTCRALDEFVAKVQSLVEWAPTGSTLLLYGGPSLREQLVKAFHSFTESLIPLSTQRFLFNVKK